MNTENTNIVKSSNNKNHWQPKEIIFADTTKGKSDFQLYLIDKFAKRHPRSKSNIKLIIS